MTSLFKISPKSIPAISAEKERNIAPFFATKHQYKKAAQSVSQHESKFDQLFDNKLNIFNIERRY